MNKQLGLAHPKTSADGFEVMDLLCLVTAFPLTHNHLYAYNIINKNRTLIIQSHSWRS
jgi:hypothetical protein